MSTREQLDAYIGRLERRLRLSVLLRGTAILAGAAALAAYALEYKKDYAWPDKRDHSDDFADDFAGALLRSLSGAISAGAVS